MKTIALIIVFAAMILFVGCNGIENGEAILTTTTTETTTAIEMANPVSIEEFEFGQSPEDLLNVLRNNDMELDTDHPQSWDYIESVLGDAAVQDGRIYNTDGFHFWYRTDDAMFFFAPEGVFRSISVLSPRIRTSFDVGVGDNFDDVVAAHGTDFVERIWSQRVIEYFDGEVYLTFVFEADGDIVLSWRVRPWSMLDEEL